MTHRGREGDALAVVDESRHLHLEALQLSKRYLHAGLAGQGLLSGRSSASARSLTLAFSFARGAGLGGSAAGQQGLREAVQEQRVDVAESSLILGDGTVNERKQVSGTQTGSVKHTHRVRSVRASVRVAGLRSRCASRSSSYNKTQHA